VYFLLATMMSATAWRGLVKPITKGYKLSMAQRTLMLQVIAFLTYLLCAAAVYHKIEGWQYLDAVYWTTVTLFTIGFGDFSPSTHLGRGLLFPMALGGILFVGLIVASVSSVGLARGSQKISRRNIEKAREEIVKQQGQHQGTNKVGQDESSTIQQREQEFNLMRKAQKNAGRKNATIALSVSAGSWLLLWLLGGVIFWQAELDTQGWSYFQALYFTYVAFTTIGYGDFYPQSNSAKPTFVLWAMLALPTLTVLIGAIGDSISEGVSAATLFLGEKLPAKTTGLAKLKDTANKTKKGDDGAFKEAKPPGFMDDNEDQDIGSDPEAQAVQGIMGDESSNGDANKASQGEQYRGYLIMKEMENVVEHMNASPPRQYTFAEWTWFLKLLGEDETSWSWLGAKSPIITTTDEPSWVLKRLMARLRDELKEQANERTGNT